MIHRDQSPPRDGTKYVIIRDPSRDFTEFLDRQGVDVYIRHDEHGHHWAVFSQGKEVKMYVTYQKPSKKDEYDHSALVEDVGYFLNELEEAGVRRVWVDGQMIYWKEPPLVDLIPV